MTFDLTPTAAQHNLARRTHEFAESVIRPVALDYDQRQICPGRCLEEGAAAGLLRPAVLPRPHRRPNGYFVGCSWRSCFGVAPESVWRS